MKKYIKFCLAGLCFITLIAGCSPAGNSDNPLPTPTESENTPIPENPATPGGNTPQTNTDTPSEGTNPVITPSETSPVGLPEHSEITTIVPDTDFFTKRDMDASYNESKSISIQLNGTSVSCNSKSVRIDGTTVTILGDGTYLLSGSLENGQIIANGTPEEVANNPKVIKAYLGGDISVTAG